ncbi:hypothetical protein D9615_008774 [Tricholomella constricta]|uniref:Uncharacterized protein n=1 Tax=Tricholomella constricta TaxID=117010 RepID=A0A8H5H7U3_9AGAR|nr:hypothetical protein D9615_008774 [Tricholomella constricta]
MDAEDSLIAAVSHTKSLSESTSAPPMFNFPKEEPRNFTAADLIAILRAYGGDKEESSPPKRPTSTLTAEELIDIILGGKTEQRRVVFRHWPRAPTGKSIIPENSFHGKQTPNGIQLWGATLFDFYRVRRIPNLANLSTLSTGSKLLRWMKATGELDYAKDEIEWAETEDEPMVIQPWSPREAIEKMEQQIKQGKVGRAMPEVTSSKGKKASTGSTFKRSNYPAPGPLVPFSYTTERLTDLIPLERLPKKVIVHDPWNLLAVKTSNRYGYAKHKAADTEWTSRPDRTYTYYLNLSDATQARLQAEAAARAARKPGDYKDPANDDRFLAMTSPPSILTGFEGYLIPPTATPGPIPPPIFVVHEPPPCPVASESTEHEPFEEAHLYISPAHQIGVGNHSVVYQAEWELPRSAIIPPPSTDPVICKECVQVDIHRILKEVDGEHGERMEAQWKEKSATLSVIQKGRPPVTFHVVDAHDFEAGNDKGDGCQVSLADTRPYCFELEGPVRPIRTTVGWQDPLHPTCEHIKPPPEVPPTVKVRVVAKLSNPGDTHLASEAENYQDFKKHMFENWSGLNILPPMHDPVPVGALVPQFYGYYEWDRYSDSDDDDETEDEVVDDGQATEGVEGEQVASKTTKRELQPIGYLSPILLLEDCGEMVDARELTLDQK